MPTEYLYSVSRRKYICYFSNMRVSLHRFAMIFLGLIALLSLGWLGYAYLYQSIAVSNFEIVNVTDTSATLVWTTDKEAFGNVEVSNSESGKIVYYDERDLEVNDKGEYTFIPSIARPRFSHFVILRNLLPEKMYSFSINVNGISRKVEGGSSSFTTHPTLGSLSNPDPVYGKVFSQDRGVVDDGYVLFSRQNAKGIRSQKIASPISNSTYTLDIQNLRVVEKSDMYIGDNNDREIAEYFIGYEGGVHKALYAFSAEQDQPVNDVLVSTKDAVKAASDSLTALRAKAQSYCLSSCGIDQNGDGALSISEANFGTPGTAGWCSCCDSNCVSGLSCGVADPSNYQ